MLTQTMIIDGKEVINQNYKVVSPLIGRDYKSGREAEAAFLAGYDFQLEPEGMACSVRDFAPGTKVSVRFKRMTMVKNVATPNDAQQIKPDTSHAKFIEGLRKKV